MSEHHNAVPGPCDRIGECKKTMSCYGWDYCRAARIECTEEEWDLLWEKVFGVVTKRRET